MSRTLCRPMLTQETRASVSVGACHIIPILGVPILARLLQLGVRIHVAAEMARNLTGRRMTLDS